MSDTLASARPGASPEAIMAHYDTGNEFFRLWIGPELIYSCALFEEGDDLARAQIRKLDHHIEAAGAPGAERVLEIGCGWGALMRRLVTHWNVKHVVGLTLSPAQARGSASTRPPASRSGSRTGATTRPSGPMTPSFRSRRSRRSCITAWSPPPGWRPSASMTS